MSTETKFTPEILRDMADTFQREAGNAMSSLCCGSENWEYRVAGQKADLYNDAATLAKTYDDLLKQNATLQNDLSQMAVLANELLKSATDLAQYASYAEIVGGVSVNRSQVRKNCDEVFSIRKRLPKDENFEPIFAIPSSGLS